MKIPNDQISIVVILLALFATTLGGFALPRSTIKIHATNYKWIFFNTQDAGLLVNYFKVVGIIWTPDTDYLEFGIPAYYWMILVRLCPYDYLYPM